MSSDLEPLRAAVRADRAGAWIGAGIFQLFAMACVLPLSPKFCEAINMQSPGGGAWVLGGFGAGLALAGAYFARRALLQRDVDRTPMLRKLLHEPEDVVWVHAGMGVDYRAYGTTVNRTRFVSVLCESRENQSMEVRADAAARILSALEHHLPHATVGGFSQEMLERYKADPSSLRIVPRAPSAREEAGGYREPATPRKQRPAPPPEPRAPYVLVALVALALTALAPAAFEAASPATEDDGPERLQ
jgi:hypothetical protein